MVQTPRRRIRRAQLSNPALPLIMKTPRMRMRMLELVKHYYEEHLELRALLVFNFVSNYHYHIPLYCLVFKIQLML